MKRRLNLIAAVILLAGLGSAAIIYLTAGNGPESAFGPGGIEDSRMYTHDLELYGGKFSVEADEFTRWFGGLWHGRSLAFPVAFMAAAASLGFFIAARRLPPGSGKSDKDKPSEVNSRG